MLFITRKSSLEDILWVKEERLFAKCSAGVALLMVIPEEMTFTFWMNSIGLSTDLSNKKEVVFQLTFKEINHTIWLSSNPMELQ